MCIRDRLGEPFDQRRGAGLVPGRLGQDQVEPGLIFDLTTMVPLGLVLNELITNSFKHAFKGRDGGAISLTVQGAAEGAFDLLYADDGVGIPQEKISGEGSLSLIHI